MENDNDYETTYSQAFVNYDGDKPVSYFAIDKQKDGTADVSLATNSNYQGKGYGSKAAKEGVDYIRDHLDDYKEVFWATKPDNIASQKLAEKNGFELVRDDDEWKTYSLKGKKK